MMKVCDSERLGKDYFVRVSGDEGFEIDEVFRVLQKVMHTRKQVRGMIKIFKSNLTEQGYIFAIQFVDDWVELGMWGYLMKCDEMDV